MLKLLDTPHNEFMVLGITLNIYFLNFEEKSISMGLGMLLTKVKLEELLEALALLRKGLKTGMTKMERQLSEPLMNTLVKF